MRRLPNKRFEGPTWSRIQRPAFEHLIGESWLDSCIAAEVRPERRREDPAPRPASLLGSATLQDSN